MDESYLEMAEALGASILADSIRRAQVVAFPDDILSPENYIRRDCEDCGDDLIEFRMQRGRLKCIICQARSERKLG